MYQLIKGTAHCHRHGVMHRDLKPQNLLVDDDTECLKIADLGLGRAFSIPIKSYTHEVGFVTAAEDVVAILGLRLVASFLRNLQQCLPESLRFLQHLVPDADCHPLVQSA